MKSKNEMKKTDDHEHMHGAWCCGHSKRFPVFAIFLFIIALAWLLNDLNIVSINLPWIPLALLLFAIGMLMNFYCRE